MTAKDCIMGRRSIRVFEDKPISEEVLKEIVTEASYAPSWKHTQITRYVAVTGELKEKIAAECCNDYAKTVEIKKEIKIKEEKKSFDPVEFLENYQADENGEIEEWDAPFNSEDDDDEPPPRIVDYDIDDFDSEGDVVYLNTEGDN